MSATTTLEAVNIMLSTIGEAPVNSLGSGLVDAEIAASILASTSRSVQSRGWNFNREYNFPFVPAITGEIYLPNNVLRADATLDTDSKDLVQRGSQMYDRKNHTYQIAEQVNLDIVLELEFEELPEVARRYIFIKAARVFQDRVLGSDTLHGFQQRDEMAALLDLQDFDSESEDHNIFQSFDVYRVIDRNGGL